MLNPSAYYELHSFQVRLGGQSVEVVSKPGLPDWKKITPVETLLAEHVHPSPGDRLLLYGCRNGALGVPLARRVAPGTLALNDLTILSATCGHETLRRNGIENAHFEPQPYSSLDQAISFDAIVILLPKGRKLLRRWLAESRLLLREGGHLYLGGANQEGIHPAVKDAQAIFGQGGVLGYRKGCRAVRFVKHQSAGELPEWLQEAGIAPGSWHLIQFEVQGEAFQFATLPGVFSYEGLDDGTRFLLEQLPPVQGMQVLDFGCGCGVIGALAGYYGAESVDMLDANLLAVRAAQENISRLGLKQARAFASDGLQAVGDQQYDLMLSNPPFQEAGWCWSPTASFATSG
jgi:16S rRNA (guanine1207-N2)-methyltransferase